MGKKFTASSTGYIPCPKGMHPAVCCDIIDHGVEVTQWGPKEKISLVFQIVVDGEVYYLRKKYTFSSHPKSTLAQDIESWTGRLPEVDDDIEDFLGMSATLNVTHTPKQDNPEEFWANVRTINPAGEKISIVTNGDGLPEAYKVPDDSMVYQTSDIPF